ncbi:hypothetical protein BT69DRAFT_1292930 [Atractiella rhizophila]|nr:hypothetical protein BT69DRAFT_1292930 [Atractiella rhizophila]
MASSHNLILTKQFLNALFTQANIGNDFEDKVEKVISALEDTNVGELEKPEIIRDCLGGLLKSPVDGSDLLSPSSLDSVTLSLLHRHKADSVSSFTLLPSSGGLPSPSLFSRPSIPRSGSQTYVPALNHKGSSSSLRSNNSTGAGGSTLKNSFLPAAPGTPTSPFAPVSPSPLARRINRAGDEDDDSGALDEVRSRTSTDSRNSGGDGSSSGGGLNAFATEFKPRLSGVTGTGSSSSLNILPKNSPASSFDELPNQNLTSASLSQRASPPPMLPPGLSPKLNAARLVKHIDLPPRGLTPTDPASLWNSSPLGTPTKFPTLVATPPIPSPAGSDIPRNPWSDDSPFPGITGLASGISGISLGGLGRNGSGLQDEQTYDPWADTPAANPNIHSGGAGSGANTPSRRYGQEDVWGLGLGGLSTGIPFEGPGHSPVYEFNDPIASLALSQAAGSSSLTSTGLNGYQTTYEMTPLDFLYTLFSSPEGGGVDLEPEELEEALNRNNYDINKTVEFILESRFVTSSANTGNIVGLRESFDGMEIKPMGPGGGGSNRNSLLMGSGSRPIIVSRDSFDRQFRPGGGGGSNPGSRPHTPTGGGRFGMGGRPVTPTGGGGKVCRYYLQGACLRSDCRYSHDVGKAVCKFWLRGNCLKGPERCGFLHSIPPVMTADSLEKQYPGELNLDPTGDGDPDLSDYIDFPTLDNHSPRMAHSLSGGMDPSRQRFSQAVKYGRPHPSLHGGRKEVRTPPVQPRPSPRVNLRPPQLLPTLKTGADLQNLYAHYRENFLQLGTMRNKLLAKAAEAWRKGDGAAARKFSREANEVNRNVSLAGRQAAARILDERRRCLKEAVAAQVWKPSQVDEKPDRAQRARDVGGGLGVILGVVAQRPDGAQLTADERTEAAIDLHGLHPDEAIEFLEKFLSALESEQFMGQTYLIVGLERHTGQGEGQRSQGRQRLAQAVMEYLSGNLYPWRDLKTGIIVVDAAR